MKICFVVISFSSGIWGIAPVAPSSFDIWQHKIRILNIGGANLTVIWQSTYPSLDETSFTFLQESPPLVLACYEGPQVTSLLVSALMNIKTDTHLRSMVGSSLRGLGRSHALLYSE